MDTTPVQTRTAHPLDLTAGQIVVAALRLFLRTMSNACQAVYRWQDHTRQKAALRELDERMLADLGLTRSDIELAFRPSQFDRIRH